MKLIKLDHIGIRVICIETAINFYQSLGFMVTRQDPNEHVVVLKHQSGIELNLLDSGNNANAKKNILMDIDSKYPGYTHYAITVDSVTEAKKFLHSANITVTEGPVIFGDGKTSIFVRDPDANVIEFTELPQ